VFSLCCSCFCIIFLVEICLVNTFSCVFLFLFSLLDLYYFFCFSCSGWGIGPSGGVVEPDLVAKMRSDEGSGGNFVYGPAVMVSL
jgi:hypothetical protein